MQTLKIWKNDIDLQMIVMKRDKLATNIASRLQYFLNLLTLGEIQSKTTYKTNEEGLMKMLSTIFKNCKIHAAHSIVLILSYAYSAWWKAEGKSVTILMRCVFFRLLQVPWLFQWLIKRLSSLHKVKCCMYLWKEVCVNRSKNQFEKIDEWCILLFQIPLCHLSQRMSSFLCLIRVFVVKKNCNKISFIDYYFFYWSHIIQQTI